MDQNSKNLKEYARKISFLSLYHSYQFSSMEVTTVQQNPHVAFRCVFGFFLKYKQIIFKFYLFIYLWLCSVFVSVRGPSLAVASGGHSSSRCTGLSLSRPLPITASPIAEHRLSNCGSRVQLLRGMWDLPRPVLEPDRKSTRLNSSH